MSENIYGHYLSKLEINQFKMDCPACGLTVNLSEFSEHLKEDVEEIRVKCDHAE